MNIINSRGGCRGTPPSPPGYGPAYTEKNMQGSTGQVGRTIVKKRYPEPEDRKFKDPFSYFRSGHGQREIKYWLVQKLAKKIKFAKIRKNEYK